MCDALSQSPPITYSPSTSTYGPGVHLSIFWPCLYLSTWCIPLATISIKVKVKVKVKTFLKRTLCLRVWCSAVFPFFRFFLKTKQNKTLWQHQAQWNNPYANLFWQSWHVCTEIPSVNFRSLYLDRRWHFVLIIWFHGSDRNLCNNTRMRSHFEVMFWLHLNHWLLEQRIIEYLKKEITFGVPLYNSSTTVHCYVCPLKKKIKSMWKNEILFSNFC